MADILSKQDALHFLTHVLKMEEAESRWEKNSKLDLLKEIIKRWYENVAFQNIDQLCLTRREGRLPTVQEIVEKHMKGRGGICIYNAIFCWLLLAALDYNVHLSLGSISHPNDHAVVVASNVQQTGDSYLVEVGCGWPAFSPVHLNCLTPDIWTSEIYRDSTLEYCYVRENEDILVRYHRRGDFIPTRNKPDVGDGWKRHSQLNLKPVSVEFLYSEDNGIYKTLIDQSVDGMTRFLVAVLYPKQFVHAVKDQILIRDSKDGRDVTPLETKQRMIDELIELCPFIDPNEASEAFDFVQENVKKWGHSHLEIQQ